MARGALGHAAEVFDVFGGPEDEQPGLPPGLAINPTTGIITGTVALGAGYEGTYTVTVVANDGTNSATQSFPWNIFSPLTIGQLADQTNTENDSVSLAITASDTVSGATVSYAALGLPPGLAINPTSGVISGVVARDAAAFGPYSVTVIAQDGTYSAQMVFTWNVNSPLTFTTPADQTNNESDVVSLAVSATDSISGSTVVYSAVGLPGGLSINPTTGLITGTVAVGDAGIGSFSPTIIANDGTYYTTTTFDWTINGAVTINDPVDQANTVGDTVSLLVDATDTNTGATVAYAAQGLPAGLVINTSTGLISGTVSSSAASIGTYVTTVFASDGTSSSSDTFDWTIKASGTVTLATPSNQTGTEGTAISTLSLSASDSTSGATLHFFGEGLPPGLVLNPATGAITGTPASGDAAYSPYTVTVIANDGGAFAQVTFTWSITDPVAFTAVAANQSSTEGATPTATFGASDASSGTVHYTAVGLPPGLSMNPDTGAISGSVALGAAAVGSYTVTVTANDGTYSASETFTWSVASPITLTAPSSESSTEGGSVSVASSAIDASSGTVTYTAVGLPQGLSVNSSTGAITGKVAVGASGIGSFRYTLVASDGTYSTAQTGTWTVTNPITILSVPEVSFNASQMISYQVQTTYTGSGSLSYAAMGLPAGVTINPMTGWIAGKFETGPGMRGTYVATVWVTDGTYKVTEGLTIAILGDPTTSVASSPGAPHIAYTVVNWALQSPFLRLVSAPLFFRPDETLAQKFWKTVENWTSTRTFEVNHLKQQALRARYLAEKGVNVDAQEHLRGVHIDVHNEIGDVQDKWKRAQMARMGLDPNKQGDTQKFWARVEWKEIENQEKLIEETYGPYMIKAGAKEAEWTRVANKTDSLAKIRAFQAGRGARLAKLLPALAKGLAIFGVIAAGAENAYAIAENGPEVQRAWDNFEAQYNTLLALAMEGKPVRAAAAHNLVDAYGQYLAASKFDEQQRMEIITLMHAKIDSRPDLFPQ